jgi:hypothetical protein
MELQFHPDFAWMLGQELLPLKTLALHAKNFSLGRHFFTFIKEIIVNKWGKKGRLNDKRMFVRGELIIYCITRF